MIVEADREEDEEEKKVASKATGFKVPQKLHEFRLQAAAKEIQGKTNNTNFSNMRTDFSMTSKQQTLIGEASASRINSTTNTILKNATVKSRLSETQHSRKGNNLFGQRNKKPDVLPIAPP